MSDSVLFFDLFFKLNDEVVGNKFVDMLHLPPDVAELVRRFYIKGDVEKVIAHDLSIEERTVRKKLSYARDMTRMKAVGWLSSYIMSLPDS